jgi:HlyD family secretion protein
MSPRFRWILIAILGAAVGVGVIGYARSRKKPETHFETVKVDKGRIVARVTATGTLSALVTVQVGAQVSGRIQELKVDFNSPVKKGQVIARIDPQLFAAAVEQARANYIAAQGQLEKSKFQAVDAKRIFERNKQLFAQKLIAQADLETSESNADAAQAQVAAAQGQLEQAKASLHQAQVNLDYTTIIAPTDGVVISRNVDVGQTVAAALQAPTLFTIAQDLAKMQVDTSVAEADVGKLQPGMNATFTVDAYPSEKFRGVIRQIRNAPQTVQNVVTYDAVIDVDNSDLKLKPGMTANVTFIYAEKDSTLRVANAALRFRPTPEMLGRAPKNDAPAGSPLGGAPMRWMKPNTSEAKKNYNDAPPDQRTVWVLRDATPQPVKIKVGVSDGTVTEIAEGDISEGDQLITDVASGAGGSSMSSGPPRRGGF